MKNIFILLFLSVFFFQVSQAQTNEEIAKEKGSEAIKLMDDGHVDRSIELLEEARKLDPKSMIYPYEIAFAYYLKKDYKEAIKLLKQLEKHEGVNDLVYQLQGNAHDMDGDAKEAVKTYEKGLTIFPNSGKLYLELGIMGLKSNDFNKALGYFEKGIEVDPTHSSNYYWAAKLFCTSSEEEVWGMIYGEIFMNLERNSKRTAEMSKILYDTYKKEIKINGDSTSVSFSKDNVIYFDGNMDSAESLANLRMPFGVGIYEPTLILSLVGVKEINMQTLSDARARFVDIYFEKEYNQRYPNVLFDYQKKIKDAGHMEAYNYWLLMLGDQYESMNWQMAEQEKWKAFIEWFSENPIQINTENKFLRR